MGYADPEQIHPEIHEKTYQLSVSVKEEIRPLFLFKKEPIIKSTKTGFQSQGLRIKSCNWGTIAAGLRQPEVCCFGLTLGNEIESINKSLNKKSLLESYIWDSLCSILAEYYADQAEACLAEYYEGQGLRITRRFSPGYCDLPLMPSQNAIFRFCDMDAVGISMSSSGLMSPRKSVTGMVLAAEKIPSKSPCGFCKTPCRYRRIQRTDKN